MSLSSVSFAPRPSSPTVDSIGPIALTLGPAGSPVELSDALALTSALNGTTPDAVIEHLVSHAPPLALWLLLSRRPTLIMRGTGGRARITRLLEYALADTSPHADGKPAWSPLLDLLVTLAPDVAPEAVAGRLARVAAWATSAQDPTHIERCLDFRAPAFRAVIGRHARALTTAQAALLAEDLAVASAVLENPALRDDVRDAAATAIWGVLSKVCERNYRRHDVAVTAARDQAVALLRSLALRPQGLPPGTRERVRNAALPPSSFRIPALAREAALLLAADPTTDDWTLALMIAAAATSVLEHSTLAVDVATHPAAGPATASALSLGSFGALTSAGDRHRRRVIRERILAEVQTPAMVLDQTARALVMSSGVDAALAVVAAHPNTPPEWLREVAHRFQNRADVLRRIAATEARLDPAIRAALLRQHQLPVVVALLADRRPEEFPLLMARFVALKAHAALSYLETAGVPAGAELPAELLAPYYAREETRARAEALQVTHGAATGTAAWLALPRSVQCAVAGAMRRMAAYCHYRDAV